MNSADLPQRRGIIAEEVLKELPLLATVRGVESEVEVKIVDTGI
jgi:hypothetical protein